uniref:Macro domain-containing protein n=1 Tax=Peronospora matthiolae TaxID=2874970 RepID=A0AAV1UG54_9STRA
MATPRADTKLEKTRASAPPYGAPPLKRPRHQTTAATRTTAMPAEGPAPRCPIRRVLDVAPLLPRLVAMLDVASVANFLEVLAVDETWRDVLTFDALWKELLRLRFAGNVPVGEICGDDDHEDEDEGEEEGEGGEEGRGGDDGDRDDLAVLMEGDVETGDDDDSLGGEHVEVDLEENEGLGSGSCGDAPGSGASSGQGSEKDTGAAGKKTDQMVVNTWVENVPSPTVLAVACADLKEFLRSAEQVVQFDERVRIVRGDIGEVTVVEGQVLDGLAFPTAAFLRNPHSGAAAAVFRRAGKGLSDHVRTLDVRLDVGQVHVTPGFDASVAKLIHVVGPSGFNPQCFRDLQRTYWSVLRCIQTENLSCVAMASISTGNMGMPIDKSAWFALCAIQHYMRSTNWTATIAIVCFEADVCAAFMRNKAKILSQFNADDIRATPPLWNQ